MKPWLIITIVDGDLGEVHQKDTREDAIDLAVKLALEQGDKPEDRVRESLAANENVWLQDGEIRIHITQAEYGFAGMPTNGSE